MIRISTRGETMRMDPRSGMFYRKMSPVSVSFDVFPRGHSHVHAA